MSRLTEAAASMSARPSAVVGPSVSSMRGWIELAVTTISLVAASLIGRRAGRPAWRYSSFTWALSKPSASIITVKGPPTRRPLAAKVPSEPEVVLSVVPEGSWTTVTVAPAIGPFGPSTTPRTADEVSCA